jgi:nucleoid-associated protein YgaU
MTVLNVLSTNTIAADSSEYQTVQTGYYRVGSTAGAATVSFNGGPAITLVQNEFILIKGSKPGQAKIVKGVADATADYYVGEHVYDTSANHPFSVGDYIAIVDDSTSPAINAAFLSAGTAGKKITAIDVHNNILSTDIDSSSTSTYTWSSGPKARIARAVKITTATSAVIVEEVQVVGG